LVNNLEILGINYCCKHNFKSHIYIIVELRKQEIIECITVMK